MHSYCVRSDIFKLAKNDALVHDGTLFRWPTLFGFLLEFFLIVVFHLFSEAKKISEISCVLSSFPFIRPQCTDIILFSRGRAPFDQHQESQPLAMSNTESPRFTTSRHPAHAQNQV